MASEVKLTELRAVAMALMDSLIKEAPEGSVKIDDKADFYWEVPSDALYSVTKNQPQLDVGRLSDDWEFIRSIAESPSDATPLALIHLAPLLRALALRSNS